MALGYVSKFSENVAEGHHKCMWEFKQKVKIHLLQKVVPSSLLKATTPEFLWFYQLPQIKTNSLSQDVSFLIVSPKPIKTSVLFQNILNSNSNTEDDLPNDWSSVLSFIKDGDKKTLKVKNVPLPIVYYKSDVRISNIPISKSQDVEIKYADAAGSPLDAADAYQNTFPMDNN